MSKSEMAKAAALMGRKGGKAGKGAKKARTTVQARAAAMARWAKDREEKAS